MMRNSNRFFNVLLLCGLVGGVSVAQNVDLDAALQAQKKKAQRRVYSERAVLHDQNLVVPTGPSKEEQLADEVLKQKEASIDRSPALSRTQSVIPRPVVPVQQENRNWLLSEMNKLEEEPVLENAEDRWLTQELERRQDIRKQQALAEKEAELVNQRLREEQRLRSLQGRTQEPILSVPSVLGSRQDEETSYLLPGSSSLKPLAGLSSSRRAEQPAKPSPFSPTQSRQNSGIIQDPFNLKTVRETSAAGSAPKKSSPFDLSTEWSTQPKKELSPLERIKKSSPINRKNPFDDNPLPSLKSSIWD